MITPEYSSENNSNSLSSNSIQSKCQRLAEHHYGPNVRIQVGFLGLYPSEGHCFAEVLVEGGAIVRCFADSQNDALKQLYRKLTHPNTTEDGENEVE